MHPAKQHIRRAFDNAAATYDGAAEVQRHACQQLAAGLDPVFVPDCLLDGGCGTGFGLRLLAERYPQAWRLGIDLAPAMLVKARAPVAIAGDLEHLPLAPASIDLYWSSLTAQWCQLERLLPEAARVLRPGGRLALATLGPQTFVELRSAFAAGDAYTHTLAFPAGETIHTLLLQNGFTDIVRHGETHVSHHPDLRTLLRSVKAIGANQVGDGRRRGLMARATFARAEAAYETRRQPQGLPLTYDLFYLHTQR